MIIIMEPTASEEQIKAVEDRLNEIKSESNLHLKRTDGEEITIIAAIGDTSAVDSLQLETLVGVEKVVPISKPYKLASNEIQHHDPSIYNIGGKQVGGDSFTLIAGPCTLETREGALADALACAKGGASMIRGGIYKPRTSPFAFQGLEEKGLPILKEIAEQTGLPVVSESTSVSNVEALAEVVDVIQIGARNMQNYNLLEVVGKLDKPVLLKRGLASTLDELLQAADYILKGGQEQVILCERGIRTFENSTRFTLDLNVVSYLKLHTHLPVIVDPSHAAGDRRLVPQMSRAAAAIGADGIIVETTKNPEAARCDGPQQLYTKDFEDFASSVFAHASLIGKHPA